MVFYDILSKTILILSSLLLFLYDIKLSKNKIFPGKYKMGVGSLFLLGGSTIYLFGNTNINYINKIVIAILAIGIFMYVYRLICYIVELQFLAYKDPLTGLANRRCLFSKLHQGLAYPAETSIIFIDIDNFKSINDSLGHQTADKILCQVTKEIEQNIRPTDILGRYGGDEFILILPNTCKDTALTVLKRLQEKIQDIKFEEGVSITFSGGVSTYPEDGNTVDDLINIADKQMYKVKDKGFLRTTS